MALTTEQYERVIKFLDAQMTLPEMEAFEKELDINPAMREQLDFEQSIRDTFAMSKQNDNQTSIVNPVAKTKKIWVYLAVAASIVGIILLAALYQQKKVRKDMIVLNNSIGTKKDTNLLVNKESTQTKDSSLAAIFRHYFSKDKLPDNPPILLAEALNNYDKGKYAPIQSLDLSAIPETRGEDSENSKINILQIGHYYKGIAYLETNNCYLAIQHLDWVVAHSQNGGLEEKAEWYLALAYLKKGEKEKSQKLLKKIISKKGNTLFVEQALLLSRQLK